MASKMMKFIIAIVMINIVYGFAPSSLSRSVCIGRISMYATATSSPEFLSLEQKLTLKANAREKQSKTIAKPTTKVEQTKNVSPAKQAPVKQQQVTTKPVQSQKKAVPVTAKAVAQPTQVKSQAVVATKTTTSSPITTKAALPAATKQRVQTVKSIQASPQPAALADSDFFSGLSLGTIPFILIPALIFSSIKSQIKPPKPLPVQKAAYVTKGAYTKSFKEGSKEGLKEFFSDKKSADKELTKKGIKLSVAGFGSAILLTGVLLATSGSQVQESKEIKQTTSSVKTIVKPSVVKPPVVAVVKPSVKLPEKTVAKIVAPVASVKVDDSAAVAQKVAEEKEKAQAQAIKVASDKTEADKLLAEKEKIALEKEKVEAKKIADEKAEKIVVQAQKSAPASTVAIDSKILDQRKMANKKIITDKITAEKNAAAAAATIKTEKNAVAEKVKAEKAIADFEKKAAAAAKKEKDAATAAVTKLAREKKNAPVPAEYVPVIPKGMEVEKLDLEALKNLRKIRK